MDFKQQEEEQKQQPDAMMEDQELKVKEDETAAALSEDGSYEMVENDDSSTTLCLSNNEECGKNITGSDVDAANESSASSYQSFDEMKNSPATTPSKLNAAANRLPAMFTSSLSSFKSFAKRSLSADLDKGLAAPDMNGVAEGESQSKVEKRNLIGMAKLSIKGLIESSLSAGHILDSDHEPLQQFFVIMEYIMRQGLKAPKNFFSQNKYFWPVLECVERLASDAAVITDSARNLPGIRTYLGRGRAWLRLALMQKKLADYMKVIVDERGGAMLEWYESDAFLMCEEGVVLIGHLVGLNCIDANLCMKGDDLDNQVTVIDYSLYMKRNASQPSLHPDDVYVEGAATAGADDTGSASVSPQSGAVAPGCGGDVVQRLTDQKNYLEERNRYLETTTSELVKRSEVLETNNAQLEAELRAAKIQLSTLQDDRQRILSEKENLTVSHIKTLEEREKDLDLERETLRHSKSELDEMFQQIQKQLKHETNMRMDVERELELQMSLKQELEMSMKLLEKDVYEKQDGVVTLREQLDNVKAINQDIYHKLQDKTNLEEEKSRTIVKLEGETQKLATKVLKMQQQLTEAERQVNFARQHVESLTLQLEDSDKQKSTQASNLQIEREWREALQSQVEKGEEERAQLRHQVETLRRVEVELGEMERERDRLRETNYEQEITIQDLAGHLGQSKQEIGEIKEVHKTVVGSTWEKDKFVTECSMCSKGFNISRRKHHCRNCGQIFCNACSDNVMPLASSAKPVRVCDNCHTTLLQRFSANTS